MLTLKKKGAEPRPMPPDFPSVAPTLSGDELMVRYHCARNTIRRWSDESGVDWRGRFRKSVPPDDFRETAPTLTQTELARKYRRNGSTIKRWLSECGVDCRRVKKQYCKVDYSTEIRLCLSCPFPRCKGGNATCPRLRAPASRA